MTNALVVVVVGVWVCQGLFGWFENLNAHQKEKRWWRPVNYQAPELLEPFWLLNADILLLLGIMFLTGILTGHVLFTYL